jgi:uncharacterized membrane protein
MAAPPRTDSNPAVENVRAIVELERKVLEAQHWSDRISLAIGRFAGSLRFVIFHLAAFLLWAAWNAFAPPHWRFDPYPWGLLTFIVSMEGVLIATFVLITQNRMSHQSDHREHLDLQIDLLAEQEMTVVLRMLRRIAEHLGLPPDAGDDEQEEHLTRRTNVRDLMETIKRELPEDPDH